MKLYLRKKWGTTIFQVVSEWYKQEGVRESDRKGQKVVGEERRRVEAKDLG